MITDPIQIKDCTCKHFENWTKKNLLTENLWPLWEKYYTPITNVNSEIFKDLMKNITIEELKNIIKATLYNKATGPTGISNEVICQLPNIAISVLLNLLNSCITLSKV